MLKALLKKQFLELNSVYFQNRKTGKNRSKLGTVLYVLLFVLLFISLGGVFLGLGFLMGEPLITMGYGWLYFTLMGLIALALGVLGSVFNTYAGLYRAKDNELLLSMPIPPSAILFVRLVGVYAMGMLYEALVMIPTVIIWWIYSPVHSAGILVQQILLILMLGLLILTLTCLLGWLVALISGRLKNKSFVTVALSLLFLTVYYVVYFRINTFLQGVVSNADAIGGAIRGAAYPLYVFGRAGEGHWGSSALFAAAALVLFVVCCYVMSRSFRRIATMNRGEKKAVYKEETAARIGNTKSALLRKELRRFLSSPTYMMNCGLGVLLMAIAAVLVLVKMDTIREFLMEFLTEVPEAEAFLPLAVGSAVAMLGAMIDISAPSVSLEGKSIWLVQSLPVSPWEVLSAKLKLHILLATPPTLLCTAALAFVMRCTLTCAVMCMAQQFLFTVFLAALGLILNLKKPTLTWTNETVPVKQSLAVLIDIFGGWAIALAMGALYYPLRNVLSAESYLAILLVVLALLCRWMLSWLQKRGSSILARL